MNDHGFTLYTSGANGGGLILLNTGEGEGERVWQAARTLTDVPFDLAAIDIANWNDDLSPWPAPAVFRGEAPFGGGADAYLERLTQKLLPAMLDGLGREPDYLGIAGYSLAGLFAIYAAARDECFSRVVSASGSLWYPGFLDYIADAPCTPRVAYLSVGDREARTRNVTMKTVEDNARRLHGYFAAHGVKTTFELNPGNHFQDADARMGKGIAWIVSAQCPAKLSIRPPRTFD